MADIVLVQPVVGLLDNIKTAPGLPLSLLSAVKLVFREFEVKIIDQRLDFSWRETLKKELKKRPLLVGTTAMLGPQVEFARAVGEETKKYSSKTPVVWGGPHPSVLPTQTVTDETVDIVIQGDGEETFLKLAHALKKKKSLKSIHGLYFKKENGEVVYTGQAPLINLNQMPDIPYELVDIYKYLPRRGDVLALDMETSRGCPFKCRFCYNPIFNRGRWRALKAEIVFERIKKVVSQYKIKGIWFIDDEFFIDLGRARKIIEGLLEMNLHWTVQGVTAKSVLAMDKDFLSLLEKSGCEQLNIGAESGSLRILKMVNKGITPEDILAINRKLKPYQIMPWFYFMIGFPGETKRDIDETLKLVFRLLEENPKAKISAIGCFTPYPGTSLFEEAKKYGYKPPDSLLGWKTYAVDQINVPWIKGRLKRKIEAIQFASFFVDEKARDVASSPIIRLIADFYRPFARFRLKQQFWDLPLDVMIGNKIKRELAKRRISAF